MAYRPKDWRNEFKESLDEMMKAPLRLPFEREFVTAEKAYEAGADAILAALCTSENRLDCIDQYGNDPAKLVKGWLVFIPE